MIINGESFTFKINLPVLTVISTALLLTLKKTEGLNCNLAVHWS